MDWIKITVLFAVMQTLAAVAEEKLPVEFFASRGYAVLQMNFRGSTGYGHQFRNAGLKQWGLDMQDDITDSTEWLIKSGVVDRNRICIVGASYGGYAALMGLAKIPDLHKCAVSFAGVSDLRELLYTARFYTSAKVVEQADGDHYLGRYEHRLQLFKEMEQFLAQYL